MSRITIHPAIVLAWGIANVEACRAGSDLIQPEHFLLAILNIIDDAYQGDAELLGFGNLDHEDVHPEAAKARAILSIPPEDVTRARRLLGKRLRQSGEATIAGRLHRSEGSRLLFQRAATNAEHDASDVVGLAHLLRALLAEVPAPARDLLPRREPSQTDNENGQGQAENTEGTRGDLGGRRRGPGAPTPSLDTLGRDLTHLAQQGRLTPVVGRQREMRSLVRYMARTTKRNVILIGEAGVGKTAIVEGVAQLAVSTTTPEPLRGVRIVQVSVADLVAGTKYRGDMEKRVGELIAEATGNPRMILFLDEVHLIAGAGTGGEAGLDIANMLKPALARDDFRCIGATTTAEFDRYIRQDEALMRRFQVLRVPEPTQEQATTICMDWARRIERLQKVSIDDDAVKACVELSARFIHDRFLPDKAIDLLENAATFVRIPTLSQREISPSKVEPRVTRADIEAILKEEYGLGISPAEMINPEDAERLLRERLFGQDQAIAEMVSGLTAVRQRPPARRRSLAVFLFMGPTGVGKTFAAELLREALFPDQEPVAGVFRLSELKERHEIARLTGAPPGFIGHEQPGALFRFARAYPAGLILLDEVDKAHPELVDFFLGVFDQGEARDAQGRPVDFSRYVFVLTANPSEAAGTGRSIGFRTKDDSSQSAADVKKALGSQFREELLSRIDRVVVFNLLDPKAAVQIIKGESELLVARIREERGIEVVIASDVIEGVASLRDLSREGARGLMRAFEDTVALPLSDLAKTSNAQSIRVTWKDGRLETHA